MGGEMTLSPPLVRVFAWPDTIRAWPNEKSTEDGTACSLGDALTRRWQTDAHFVAYEALVDEPHGRKRLNVRAPAAGAHVVLHWGVIDIDAPKHSDATPEWREAERAKVARLIAEHPGLVAYDTRHGYRLVGALRAPHTITTEASVTAWRNVVARRLAWLSRVYEIVADSACHDWPRFYRLPRVAREGGATETEITGDPYALGAWPDAHDEDLEQDLAEIRRLASVCVGKTHWASHLARLSPSPRPSRVRGVRSRQVVSPPPSLAVLSPTIAAVAGAILAVPGGVRHAVLQSVVGACSDAGWSRAMLTAFGRELAPALAGLREKRDDGEIDRLIEDTADRAAAAAEGTRGHYRGRASLRLDAPAVAEALEECIRVVDSARADGLPYAAGATLGAFSRVAFGAIAPIDDSLALRWRRALDARRAPSERSADEATGRIVQSARDCRASRGLQVLAATTGAGKTWSHCAEAAEASRGGKSTGIAVPSHAVAKQVLAHLAAEGAEGVLYVRGLLALRDERGAPVCRKAQAVETLAAAGLDAGDVLCEGRHYGTPKDARQGRLHLPVLEQPTGADAPCEHLATCRAYAERREAMAALPAARVVVTVHQLAPVLVEWIRGREDALVVIDEAPPLLEVTRATVSELRTAADEIDARQSAVVRRERWRGDLLRSLAEGVVRQHTSETATDLRGLLSAGCVATQLEGTTEALLEQWIAASERHVSATGEATGGERKRFAPRPSKRERKRVAAGDDRPLTAVALAGRISAALVAEARAMGARVEVGTRARGDLAGAPELRLVVVNEGLRTLLTDRSIGRQVLDATCDTRLLAAVLGESVTPVAVPVRDAVPVARVFIPWAHGTRSDCLPDGSDGAIAWDEVTSPLAEAIATAAQDLERGDEIAVFTWRPLERALDRRTGLPAALEQVLADLNGRGVRLSLGHYGHTRGRDDWRGARAILAFGTPWPDGDDVALQCAAAGVPDASVIDVAAHVAAAELEQVCGRGRACRRDRPLRIVVVATRPPLRADRRWTVRELAVGRPVSVDRAHLASRAEAIGVKAAAREAGVDPKTVRRAVAAVGGGRHGGLFAEHNDAPTSPAEGGGGEAKPGRSISGPGFAPPTPPPLSDHPTVTGQAPPLTRPPIARSVITVYSSTHGANEADGDGSTGGGGVRAGEHRRATPRTCRPTGCHRAVGGT